MAEERLALAPGAQVDLRGRRWLVEQVTAHVDCESIRLRATEPATTQTQTFLLPFDRPSLVDRAAGARVLGRRPYFEFLREQLLSSHPFGSLQTAAGSAFELKAFQLEPALAMLRRGRLRLFIADAVGLGKTIQAGLIVKELSARIETFRALIVVPAGLRLQWHDELSRRFSLETTIADTHWLVSMSGDLPPDVNPWALPGVYLASYDLLKQPEVLRPLEDVRWDLLVADEVHGAGPGTARLKALQTFGRRARRIVLLSATPPDGEPAALDALANLGWLRGERPITMFRRSRADVGYPGSRKTVLLAVRLNAAERLMHARLDRYTKRVWAESLNRNEAAARLAAMVLRKRALSTAGSLLASVRRRLALLSAAPRVADEQLRLPLYDEDPLPDEADDEILATPGLADADAERRVLTDIARAAELAVLGESKVRALQRLIRRAAEPMVVFTEYRDTAAQLARAFWPLQPLILDGAMTPAERAEAQRAFAAGGRVLFATDAASEGLNLHERCRTIVHFELPWMPMRLEQRAGRVDRIGQTKKVHEILLVARHTSERYVLGPLVRRFRAVQMSTADSRLASLTESSVAAHVLGGTRLDPPSAPRTPPDERPSLRDEASEESSRVAALRRLSRPSVRSPATSGQGTAVCCGHWLTGRVCLVARWRISSGGTILAEHLLTFSATFCPRSRPQTRADLRRVADGLIARITPDLLARTGAIAALQRSRHSAREALSALAARERSMAEHEPKRTTVQPGLFDARALRQAEARDRAAALLVEETATEVARLVDAPLDTRLDIVGIHPVSIRP